MSLPTINQTIATPSVTLSSTGATSAAAAFPAPADPTAATGQGAVSNNPITSLSSDLQSYLLQQSQGDGAQAGKAHHHHHGASTSGTRTDAPTLPGGTSAVTA